LPAASASSRASASGKAGLSGEALRCRSHRSGGIALDNQLAVAALPRSLRRWLEPAALVVTSAAGLALALTLAATAPRYDLHAYWAIDLADLYGRTTSLQAGDGFFYAPPVALVLAPLGWLPWAAANLVWWAVELGALVYIGGRWALALVLLPPVVLDLWFGNVYLLLAAMIVAGVTRAAPWGVGLFTKVTPAIGLAWSAARGPSRQIARALVLFAVVMVVSLVVQGLATWQAWFAALTRLAGLPIPPGAIPIPLLPRVLIATGVTVYAARVGGAWLLPIVVTLAMPTLWPIAFAPLVALLGLARRKQLRVPALPRTFGRPSPVPQPAVDARLS
jgi:Glycosyltransferase family 87